MDTDTLVKYFASYFNVYSVALLFIGSYVVYQIFRAIYLMYFSPLAKFPGSKWAAVTEFWEAWYNIGFSPGKQGQTLFVLERMHKDPKYGSAIRMGPNEIHINDPRYFHELYSPGSKYYKDPAMHKVLGAPTSTVAETDPIRHRQRRAPLESLFSRKSILNLEPMFMEKIDLCCTRFDEFWAKGKPVKMELALKSLTIDMVSEFAFGQSLGALHDEELQSIYVKAFTYYLQSLHIVKAFPVVSYMKDLPFFLAKRISHMAEMGSQLENMARKRINQFIVAYEKGSVPPFPTVVERLITPNPEKGFVPVNRVGLRDEILTMISAGNDTTGITTMVGLFNILYNPQIHARLLEELKTILPKPDSRAKYLDIEKLPYLSAVVKESLRYASPAASRTPRLVPPGGVTLPDGRFIPAGARVGMAIYLIHYNEDIFPEPRVFSPERWLQPPEKIAEQLKFLVPFSKGTRSCIGINLAYMEIYMIIAYLIRRYDLQLYETTPADMQWDDMVLPLFHGTFRVMTKRRTE